MKDRLTRSEERALACVAHGAPWEGAEDGKLHAARLTVLKRLARRDLVVFADDWTLTVYGVAYVAALRLGQRVEVLA